MRILSVLVVHYLLSGNVFSFERDTSVFVQKTDHFLCDVSLFPNIENVAGTRAQQFEFYSTTSPETYVFQHQSAMSAQNQVRVATSFGVGCDSYGSITVDTAAPKVDRIPDFSYGTAQRTFLVHSDVSQLINKSSRSDAKYGRIICRKTAAMMDDSYLVGGIKKPPELLDMSNVLLRQFKNDLSGIALFSDSAICKEKTDPIFVIGCQFIESVVIYHACWRSSRLRGDVVSFEYIYDRAGRDFVFPCSRGAGHPLFALIDDSLLNVVRYHWCVLSCETCNFKAGAYA